MAAEKRTQVDGDGAACKRARASGPVVWWARNDLRIEDNPTLRMTIGEAFTDGRPAGFVFIFDPRFLDISPYGRVTDPKFEKSIKTRRPISFSGRKTCALRARFWLQCVRDVGREIEALGGSFHVCHGLPEDVLKELPAGSLVFCQEEPVSPEQMDVEDAVQAALSARGSELRREWAAMSLYQRTDLPFRIKDQMPASYSGLGVALGYKDIWTSVEQWDTAAPVRPPVPAPVRLPLVANLASLPGLVPPEILADDRAALARLGYSKEEIETAFVPDVPLGGETVARAHFDKWVAEAGDSDGKLKMAAAWDLPVSDTHTAQGHDPLQWANLSRPDGWTKLSHYMAVGCISAREIYARTRHCKNFPGVVHRLMWREFHRLRAIQFHRRLFWLQGPGRVERPWKSDPAIAAAWKEGKTGVPYIDACMRELKTTGWLAYKGRKTAGHFMVFDLNLDWRIGAFHYEDVLLDYDVAMNYGNWVVVARVDKPRAWAEGEYDNDHADLIWKLSAEQANDPSGEYIRRWVPELKGVEDRFIHAPWQMTEEDMAKSGCVIGRDYPASLVGPLDLTAKVGSDAHPFGGEAESDATAAAKQYLEQLSPQALQAVAAAAAAMASTAAKDPAA